MNAQAATTRDQRGALPVLYYLRRNREKGKREQIQVHMEVVYRIANVSYNSNAGRISLQLQGM